MEVLIICAIPVGAVLLWFLIAQGARMGESKMRELEEVIGEEVQQVMLRATAEHRKQFGKYTELEQMFDTESEARSVSREDAMRCLGLIEEEEA